MENNRVRNNINNNYSNDECFDINYAALKSGARISSIP